MDNELLELEERYALGRRKNSFYTDMSEMEKPYGSSMILGDFSDYTYNYDINSKKVIRTEIE